MWIRFSPISKKSQTKSQSVIRQSTFVKDKGDTLYIDCIPSRSSGGLHGNQLRKTYKTGSWSLTLLPCSTHWPLLSTTNPDQTCFQANLTNSNTIKGLVCCKTPHGDASWVCLHFGGRREADIRTPEQRTFLCLIESTASFLSTSIPPYRMPTTHVTIASERSLRQFHLSVTILGDFTPLSCSEEDNDRRRGPSI